MLVAMADHDPGGAAESAAAADAEQPGAPAALAGQRLRALGLSGAPFHAPAEVVSWLGAVQCQEYAVARWSLGQRATGLSEAAVDQALADGEIIRTHVLRPTWHYVAAADIRWLLALSAPRVHALNRPYYRKLELSEEVLARSNALLAQALSGGRQLTRPQLAQALAAGGIEATGLRMGYLLMYAELSAVICSGGLRGKQRTYALLDERVPPAPPRPREEALAELAARYFTSHGPATRDDFQWWASLTAADAERGLALAGARLTRHDADGRAYWRAAAAPTGGLEPSPTAHLLQAYDEYFVAYRNSRISADRTRVASAAVAAPFLHGIIMDGQYVGNWQRKLTARQMTIEVQLQRSLTAAEQAALAAAVERYAAFVGLPATMAGVP